MIEEDNYEVRKRWLWALETSLELQEHEEPSLGRKRWGMLREGKDTEYSPLSPGLPQTQDTHWLLPDSLPYMHLPDVLQIPSEISLPTPRNPLQFHKS